MRIPRFRIHFNPAHQQLTSIAFHVDMGFHIAENREGFRQAINWFSYHIHVLYRMLRQHDTCIICELFGPSASTKGHLLRLNLAPIGQFHTGNFATVRHQACNQHPFTNFHSLCTRRLEIGHRQIHRVDLPVFLESERPVNSLGAYSRHTCCNFLSRYHLRCHT